jgi:ADP-heptose:LPS heptosyltransferase
LGDCVLSTPAIHLLKTWRPDLEIGVAVDEPFYPVYLDNPDVTHILTTTESIGRFRARLVINLHGGTRSAWLTLRQMARWRAGFAHYRFQPLYNVRIPRAQEVLGVERIVHTAEHAASAVFHLGAPAGEIPRARLFAKPAKAARRYAVLHPFASAPEKCWPRFRELAERLPLPSVIIGGPGDDFSPFAGLDCVSTPLLDSMRLIGGASLFIGNDSGPAHIAAAYGVPVVALFGPSNEQVWAPWRTRHRVLKSADLSLVTLDAVLEAAASLEPES